MTPVSMLLMTQVLTFEVSTRTISLFTTHVSVPCVIFDCPYHLYFPLLPLRNDVVNKNTLAILVTAHSTP